MHFVAILEIRFRVQVNATVSLPGSKVAKRLSKKYLPFISVIISGTALKFYCDTVYILPQVPVRNWSS
jgi:hypothetical protein